MKRKIFVKNNQEELLAYYAEGLLSPRERKKIDKVIRDDLALQEELLLQQEIAASLQSKKLPAVPEPLLQSAKNLVTEEFGLNMWKIVLRVTKQAIISLKSNGSLLALTAREQFAWRGPERDEQKTVVIKKEFTSVSIMIEIARDVNASNRIMLFAQDLQTQYPVNDLRITLKDADTELESHVTHQGKMQFENVRNGRYTVDVSAPDKPIAKITLEIIQE